HARLSLVHGARVDLAGALRARNDLLLRDRPSRHPARLQRAHALSRRPPRAGRAARPADARRGAPHHRQPRAPRPDARRGGARRSRRAPCTSVRPSPTLARVAADAEAMTLGTACLVLPLRRAVEVAAQLATLDVITGGRFVFGVGLGYRDVENEAMGQDPKER